MMAAPRTWIASMDQHEFSRRLMQLAGPGPDVGQPLVEHSMILGRLGFACAVRRGQAVLLLIVLGILCYVSLSSVTSASGAGLWGLSLLHAGATLAVLRYWPYWTPGRPQREGLLALAQYPLNDLEQFLANQRTNLSVVNNTLLSDLCMQLALDRCRPKLSSKTQGQGWHE